jgi:hypothetical protein
MASKKITPKLSDPERRLQRAASGTSNNYGFTCGAYGGSANTSRARAEADAFFGRGAARLASIKQGDVAHDED